MRYIKKMMLCMLFALIANNTFAAPSALVEFVSDRVEKVQLLDFLSPGDVVQLGEDLELTLGYMNNCTREEIKGGKVIIGESGSRVEGGELKSETTQCDGGSLLLVAEQASHSGAVAFRNAPGSTESQLTIHDTSPIIILPKGGKVTIKRIDVRGDRHKIRTEKSNEKVKVDLIKHDITLTPGAKYMVSSSGRSLIFTVAEDATHNAENLMGRVIPL